MKNESVWQRAQTMRLQVAEGIAPGFDVGYDDRIPEETVQELRSFVHWAEKNYRFPITLWVDFEYKHYLVRRNGERVGYIFYWADFTGYPVFDDPEKIPMIRLPVRTEHSTIDEILGSFIDAIFYYFAWLCNEIADYDRNDETEAEAEEILEKYLKSRVNEIASI